MHLFVRLLAGAVAVTVVLLALIVLRLSAGPVSLGVLAPSLARMLEEVSPYRFEIGDLGILWRNWQQGLLVQLDNVRVSDAAGEQYAHLDDVAVGFSAQALARAMIAPSSIEANDVSITLPVHPPQPSDTESRGPDALNDLLAGLRGPRDPKHPLSYLDLARLKDVSIRQRPAGDGSAAPGKDWRLQVAEADLQRDEERRLGGHVALVMLRDGQQASADIVLAPTPATGDLALALSIAGLRPAGFADLAPPLAPLAMLDLPLQGSLDLRIGPDGRLGTASIDLAGTEGVLNLDGPLAKDAGLAPPAQHLPVHSLALRGTFDAATEALSVDAFSVGFVPGTTLYAPAPVDFRFPLAGIAGAGSYRAGKLAVQKLDLDLGRLRASLTAAVDDLLGSAAGTLTVTAADVHVDDFRRYWPPNLGPDAWEWCTQHLHDGIVPHVEAKITFVSRDGELEVTALDARFDVQRLTVAYLPPMPPVHNAAGTVTADLTKLRIDIDAGDAAGLRVGDGFVLISDLDRKDQWLDIDLLITGPVRSAMTVISAPPLDYDAKIGIDPEQTSGEVTTRLMMRFPLEDDIDADDMQIDADIQLRNVGVAGIVDGIDVSNGEARIRIDNRSLRAAASLAIAGIQGELRVSDFFVADADPRTMALFTFSHAPVQRIRQAFRKLADLDPYLVDGELAGRVTFDQSQAGVGVLAATVDLTRAALALPPIGWSKPAGKAGSWEASLRTENGRLAAVPQFELLAPGLDVAASCQLDTAGRVERAKVARLITGRTNASATLAARSDGGWDVAVTGIALDLGPLLDSPKDKRAPRETDRKLSLDALPDFTANAELETVWLADAEPLRTVRATAMQTDGRLSRANLHGSFVDGSAVTVSLVPDGNNGRVIRVDAEDAGEALRAFRVFSDARGGALQVRARIDDTDPARPLEGRVAVRRFHVVNTPILARLLSILAVSGIRDALTGRGIAFTTFEMPFSFSNDILQITDGRAFGWSLGMTFAGMVDVGAETVDVTGRLVPFYTVNNVLGRLPLLGSVMTGGERGAGVFSAAYSVKGPLENPAVSVNPASVLFPGFLRWLLEVLSNWSGTGVDAISNDASLPAP
ncbi:MAG: AsmA-like C-terminal domain-containing protein [Rhodospirillales bacterium]